MSSYMTMTSDKSKKTALILCVIGGLFGAHQYYVGRISRGLLYTFTVGLFGFGWVGDIISISAGSFRDAAGAPLRE